MYPCRVLIYVGAAAGTRGARPRYCQDIGALPQALATPARLKTLLMKAGAIVPSKGD